MVVNTYVTLHVLYHTFTYICVLSVQEVILKDILVNNKK